MLSTNRRAYLARVSSFAKSSSHSSRSSVDESSDISMERGGSRCGSSGQGGAGNEPLEGAGVEKEGPSGRRPARPNQARTPPQARDCATLQCPIAPPTDRRRSAICCLVPPHRAAR